LDRDLALQRAVVVFVVENFVCAIARAPGRCQASHMAEDGNKQSTSTEKATLIERATPTEKDITGLKYFDQIAPLLLRPCQRRGTDGSH